MVRLKALVVVGDGVDEYGDLLAIGRAGAKRLPRTHENVNVKDVLYSAKCGVHIIAFEVPDSVKVMAYTPKVEKASLERRAGLGLKPKP